MRRTQMYLTDSQRLRLGERARAEGVSEAEVVRRILDQALALDDDQARRLSEVDDTAGRLSDYPDWPEWLRKVRGRGAGPRLQKLGL